MLNTNIIIIFVICSYLIGNLSPSIILSRIYHKKDIREHGSGNAGTTNVLRVMGKKFGAIVFILDVIKPDPKALVYYRTQEEKPKKEKDKTKKFRFGTRTDIDFTTFLTAVSTSKRQGKKTLLSPASRPTSCCRIR